MPPQSHFGSSPEGFWVLLAPPGAELELPVPVDPKLTLGTPHSWLGVPRATQGRLWGPWPVSAHDDSARLKRGQPHHRVVAPRVRSHPDPGGIKPRQGGSYSRTGALGGQPWAPAASPGDPLCHPSGVIGRGTARTSGTNIWEQRHGAGTCTLSQWDQTEVPQAALGFRSSQKSHLGGENLSLLSGLSRTGFGTGFKGGMCQGHEILLGWG